MVSSSERPLSVAGDRPASAWEPLRIPVFRSLWIATLASNIGTWMHDVGAGWLMTTLAPDPVMVALVQTATTLPIFILVLPAGALADVVDRRRYLLVLQVWFAVVAALLAVLTFMGAITAWLLLALTFAMGLGTAMMMPAWAALTPELVPRTALQPAIALNSMGINVARAVGPALAGLIISTAGTGAVFALNALSYLGVIVVLARWRRTAAVSSLPGERFFAAMRAGLRFVRHAPSLHAAMIRGLGFFMFASASWALLPLVARQLVGGGPEAFGVLVGSIGAGAVAGAFVLPRLRQRLSPDHLVGGATLLYAGTTAALAKLQTLLPLVCVMAVAGAAWLTVLSSLQVAAQLALPNWVRSRGLAGFMAVFMGSMAGGSLLWGKLAAQSSIATALLVAAAGGVVAAIITWRWRLSGIDQVDLTPSMHWPTPIVHTGVTHDRGPVLVTIEYQVRPERTEQFLAAIDQLGQRRRRDGAFAWGIFEHAERPHAYIESFFVESWLEHLRQHERVTDSDRLLQQEIRTTLVTDSAPIVNHYLAPTAATGRRQPT